MEYLFPVVQAMVLGLAFLSEVSKKPVYLFGCIILQIYAALMVGDQMFYLASAVIIVACAGRGWTLYK